MDFYTSAMLTLSAIVKTITALGGFIFILSLFVHYAFILIFRLELYPVKTIVEQRSIQDLQYIYKY